MDKENLPEIDINDSDELFEHHRIEADPKQTLLRLDKFLMDRLPNVTRNKLQKAIKDGFVKVNDSEVKANYKIHPGDVVTIMLPEPPRETEVVAEDIPLDIRYEDNSLLIVHKPAGMVVHPAYQNYTGTLVNALVHHFKQLPEMEGNEGRPGLVHRIDKDTSGLLVIAKTEKAMNALASAFFHHTIERSYLAVIWGEPEEDEGTVNVPIGRSLKDRRVMQAFTDGEFGKEAITHWKVLRRLRYISIIECRLETGRTHQIRAHMKFLGHPIFNDATYGGDQIVKGTKFTKYKQFVDNCFKTCPRQALHAKTLGFRHPETGEKMYLESEIPKDMNELIFKWEHYIKYN